MLALTILLRWFQDNHVDHLTFWTAILYGLLGRPQ
jgi:hypothetical protein